MCFVLYAGTTSPFSRRVFQKDAPDLIVESLSERDAAIREHFGNPEVQYIGSTSGCGCDFPNVSLHKGAWPFFEELEPKDPERIASDRRNREALVGLLRESGEQAVELYGVWDGDFMEAPKAREDVSLERLLDSDFRFKEQGFYRVRLKSGS
jgi:hypothetical protein